MIRKPVAEVSPVNDGIAPGFPRVFCGLFLVQPTEVNLPGNTESGPLREGMQEIFVDRRFAQGALRLNGCFCGGNLLQLVFGIGHVWEQVVELLEDRPRLWNHLTGARRLLLRTAFE